MTGSGPFPFMKYQILAPCLKPFFTDYRLTPVPDTPAIPVREVRSSGYQADQHLVGNIWGNKVGIKKQAASCGSPKYISEYTEQDHPEQWQSIALLQRIQGFPPHTSGFSRHVGFV